MFDFLLNGVARDAFCDLFLGSRCAGCGVPGRCWCVRCAGALSGPAGRCTPDPTPPGLPAVWSVAVNTGPVAAAVIAHKDHGETMLARPLGTALGRALAAALRSAGEPPAPLVVPVPASRQAVRRRGYDPLARIARSAVRRPGANRARTAPRLLTALSVTRPVADQATLGSDARWSNLTGAFTVRGRFRDLIRGRQVVLVDDLITTGATLVEATRALDRAGASVCAAAVVAATARVRGAKTALDLR